MNSKVDRLVQEAMALQQAGRIEPALGIFQEVFTLDPKHPQANFSLGIAAYQTGNIGLAINHLQTAARKAGKQPMVHQLLGLALMNAGDLPNAQAALRKASSLAPKNADIHGQLGDLYRIKRQPVMARQSYENALRIDPENGYALHGMGQLEITIGNVDAAMDWLQKAISAGKELPAVYNTLTLAKKYKERPEELDQIEALIADGTGRAAPDQAGLHWAAGKIYSDLGDVPKSDIHYQKARSLSYQPFDLGAHKERIDFMKSVFNEDFFRERAEFANDTARPLLIFGMPRSGTTLVEQIVSSHSRVSSGGELSYFRHLQDELGLKARPSAALETRLRGLGPKEYRTFARQYLAILDGIDRRSAHVTDKMPHNFEMLWLIGVLFPKATLVHCERTPADTCVSLLTHSLSPAHNYTVTPDILGHYYRIYADLMEHWQKVLPGKIYQLNYEKLVEDQEAESKALIGHIGLEWEPGCLDFHKNETPVTTFSNVQVRSPIFRSSIGRWKKHRDTLKPLFESLGPLAPKT
ncbi:sulfotransferase family protein [Roseibium denhamense]|uniref:Flp pilus assembly protein TadD, contains TPR repeats n=1 Tax=Roseibium denhamense TaxID=76305 RepID=A0ABY1N6P9_9HYPH|nr:tetratricopeptide repeat-containing sulfotransferase family protein [Roseibium denhamense]MTI04360.1 sulfotransferase family protein [Roseibium denhamense]SMP00926.1 Flp pilus assembly protein TadD, contains TPR repeats [Roseibium denhamense]